MKGVKITNHAIERFKQRYYEKYKSLPENICRTMRLMMENAIFKKENHGANIYKYNEMFEFVVVKNRVITFVVVD